MIRILIILGLALGLAGVAFAQTTPDAGFSMDKLFRWLENASPFAAGLSIYLWLRSDAERKAVQAAKDSQSLQTLTSVEKFGDALENTQKIVDKAATGIDVMNRIILERLPPRRAK